jgi:carboxypeptidase Q
MKRLLLAFGIAAGVLLAQEKVDEATIAKIRSEEMEHSQVMRIEHMITDRYGPRVTGSPNHEAAVKWAIAELTRFGLKNAHSETWDFNRAGWANERAMGFINSPVKENLKFEVLGWTPSTNGTVTGSAIQLIVPQGPEVPPDPNAAAGGGRGGRGGGAQRLQPTKEEFAQWIAANQPKVRGKMVLIGKQTVVNIMADPPARRIDDAQNKQRYDPNNPNAGRGGRGGFPAAGRGGRGEQDPTRMTAAEVNDQIDKMLLDGGALVRLNDAARAEGIIVAQSHRAYDVTKTVPTVIVRNDDYGRIERLLADGEDVKLEFSILNHTYPEGKTSYNVIAEIPGTDKADEIVMLGGHLDSWHAATGATDNGIGSAVMMEAVRLIQSLGLKPRRTVRVALWSGEEEGLLGSIAYVKQHFGMAEDPKPEWYKLDCYFNVDTGTGRLRGASIFGPPEAAAALRPIFMMFEDFGVGGMSVTNSRATGGTDSTSFNNAGLPGIGGSQDPIDYNLLTHHTNLDTYERILPDDVKKDAAIIAAGVWHAATRDEMIPRFAKDQMPAPQPTR